MTRAPQTGGEHGRCRPSPRPMRRRTRRSRPRLLAAASRERGRRGAHRCPRAARLVEAIRAESGGLGGIEDFLHAYSLSTKEGLALMVLAEALLRVPDAATADRLIEDKLAAGDWTHHEVKSDALLVSASAWTLGITARIIQPGETPENIVESAAASGSACRRCGSRRGRRCGCSARISCSARPSRRRCRAPRSHREFRYSFDMLGEGARTAADAERYFDAYARRDRRDRRARRQCARCRTRPGISVKLSALHPRYEAVSRERVLARADAARAGARAQGQGARSQFHRRCRGGRPARAVARGDRRGAGRSRRSPAGTASGLRCRPIRSAPAR